MEVSTVSNAVTNNQYGVNKPKNNMFFTTVSTPSDTFEKKDASCDNKFTKLEALKNFGKGLVSPLKAIIQHPFISLGMIGATVAVCSAVPALAPVITIGFGALSLYEVGKGTYNAVKEYKHGNYDNSEKAFEKIGTGVVGTVLTALGLKNTAKTSLELVEAQKAGRPLTALEKFKIAEKVKENGLYSALKDNLKIFTKDGLKSLGNNFKPANIISRFKRHSNSIEQKPPVSSEELQRRSNMSTNDIKQASQTILDKTFDEMGIPKNLRPKLVISDELRYQTVEDANKIVSEYVTAQMRLQDFFNPNPKQYNIEVFAPGENLKAMTNEEILTRIKTVLNSDSKTASLTSDEFVLKSLLNEQSPTKGGCYTKDNHTITVQTGAYRGGGYGSLEEIVSHEALHAKMAIYRSSLPVEESQAIIKEVLRDRIINGEPEQILHKGSILGPDMMDAPKMSPKMRKDFLRWADEFIFAKGDKAESASKLNKLLDLNPEFVSQNGGTRKAALKVLQNYVTSHQNRYKCFSNSKIKDIESLTLTPEQHKIAVESLKEYVACVEGNARNGGFLTNVFGADSKTFNQYQLSPEEIMARNTAAEFEKAKISAILEDTTLPAAKRAEYMKRMQDLDFIFEYNAVGKEYYELYTKALNNPENKVLAKALKKMEKRFNEYNGIMILRNPSVQTSAAYPINITTYLPHEKQS